MPEFGATTTALVFARVERALRDMGRVATLESVPSTGYVHARVLTTFWAFADDVFVSVRQVRNSSTERDWVVQL